MTISYQNFVKMNYDSVRHLERGDRMKVIGMMWRNETQQGGSKFSSKKLIKSATKHLGTFGAEITTKGKALGKTFGAEIITKGKALRESANKKIFNHIHGKFVLKQACKNSDKYDDYREEIKDILKHLEIRELTPSEWEQVCELPEPRTIANVINIINSNLEKPTTIGREIETDTKTETEPYGTTMPTVPTPTPTPVLDRNGMGQVATNKVTDFFGTLRQSIRDASPRATRLSRNRSSKRGGNRSSKRGGNRSTRRR